MANEEMIQKHLDNFLAKIAGETPVDDEPRDSTEFWLNEIAEQGGGGTEVVANPTLAGTEDDLEGIEIDGTKYKVEQPIDVEANPSGTGSTDLNKLKVGSAIYNVPQGTEVVANPSGTGSTDLTKLQVGSTVYNIPSGGGGGGASIGGAGYTVTVNPNTFGAYEFEVMILATFNGVYGWHKWVFSMNNSQSIIDGVTMGKADPVFTNASLIGTISVTGSDGYFSGDIWTCDGQVAGITANELAWIASDLELNVAD